jgi:predicted Na+-dependent transporter
MALAVLVLARSGLLFPSMFRVSRWLIWVAVLICLLSLSLNLTTGTKWERRLWVPVLLGMVVSSVIVALSPSKRVTTTDGEEAAGTD